MSSRSRRTRERILKEAHTLLAEHGYHGVGLEEVARAAGVSRQAVYLHFASKSDLLVAVAQYLDASVGIPEIVRLIGEARNAVEALDRAVEVYAAIEPKIYDVASAIYAARRSDEAAEAAWQDRMAYRRQSAMRLAEALAAEGALADGWTVEEAADFMWALLSVHTYEYLVVERGWPMDRFISYLQAVLRSALVN